MRSNEGTKFTNEIEETRIDLHAANPELTSAQDIIAARKLEEERPMWIAKWAVEHSGKAAHTAEKKTPEQRVASDTLAIGTRIKVMFRLPEVESRNIEEAA